MRTILLCAVTGLISVAAGGCLVIVDEEEGEPPEPPVYVLDDPAIEEIDAVAKLSSDSHRLDAYERIAQRPGLSAPAQVHLVGEAMDHLSFENMKESVLMTLIRNRSFGLEGKRAVLEAIDELDFDSTRSRVLEAVNSRDDLRY